MIRHLARWLSAALLLASLILGIGVAAMWAVDAGGFKGWPIVSSRDDLGFRLERGDGVLTVAAVHQGYRPDALNTDIAAEGWANRSHDELSRMRQSAIATTPRWRFAAKSELSQFGFLRRTILVAMPQWAWLTGLVLPSSVLLGRRWSRDLRTRRRRKLGQCLACGYDLRASPDRCPECGADAAAI